jgi:peptidyl-prolyl cis-trans isomerase C
MKLSSLFVACAALALVACNKQPATDAAPATPAVPPKPPIVTVNGKALSAELFEEYVKVVTQGKPSSDLSPENRTKVIENLVRMQLFSEQAEKDGVAKDAITAARLELARLQVLQQTLAAKYLKDREPTEQELRAEYETQVASSSQTEFQARHILVPSETVALKIIKELKAGGNFAAIAREQSIDKESGKAGGDLGWFSPSRMVKPFSDALLTMKKGQVTETPVQTQFGWHVIQLLNSRERLPPAYDAVKEQLGQIVLNKKFMKYSDEMIKAAKIDPPLAGTPAAAPATAEPAVEAPK